MPGDTDPGSAPPAGPTPGPPGGRIASDALTPQRIVEALDRHVVGQARAKRAVAIALRNRLRRQAVAPPLGQDITPRNILMIGPTGVGKTEIARRLARLVGAPFVKVEASKFTEVGYVGRDVESMIRDLVAEAVHGAREEMEAAVRERAESRVEERLLDALLPTPGASAEGDAASRRRDAVRRQLRAGNLEDRRVDVEVAEAAPGQGVSIFGPGLENVDLDLSRLIPGLARPPARRRNLTIAEARPLLHADETARLVDEEQVKRTALERVQSAGIVFIDEIDKVAGREGAQGPDVSREGVQRDLLPIVEGTTVQTRWGPVRTDHVLFIAAGAFHVSRPADLIPELQGRFPVRVELQSLGREDFVRILREPDSSLARQAEALLATEGVTLRFSDDGLEAIADYAARVNASAQDIGARRLYTVLETVLEDISFRASELAGQEVIVDAELVRDRLAAIVADDDYARYVL